MLRLSFFTLLRNNRPIRGAFLTLLVSLAAVAQAEEPSSIGTTWTIRSAPAGLREVVYGAGKFVAFGAGKLATSPDGVTWTEQTPPPGNSWAASVFAQGKFVALSSADSAEFPTNVMTSSDGLNWSLASDGMAPGTYWRSIAFGNGIFVAGSAGTFSTTYMAVSPDAATWTSIQPSTGGLGIVELAFGNGVFVAAQSSNGLPNVPSLLRSANGTDWQEQNLPASASPELYGITFGRGQFIAVGGDKTIITSPDGITWTRRSESGSFYLTEVVDTGEMYIAFGFENASVNSIILTSPDGVSWTEQTSPSTISRSSAAYAHGIVVALAALETTADTVITSGSFKIAADITFERGKSRLSDEAKSILANNLSELDISRKVRLSVKAQSTRSLRTIRLARRRVQAVSTYVRSLRSSLLTRKTSVKISRRVASTSRDLVATELTYR